jgi:hypothetical protein
MELIIPQPDLHQDCLDKLSRALDLVLKTAEAAGAENNHKVVIQSAREVTRIAALIYKMTNSKTKPAPSRRGGLAGAQIVGPIAPGKKPSSRPEPSARNHPAAGQTDINPEELIMPDLETLFTPDDLAYWEHVPGDTFKKFSDNYRELQALGKEVADFLLPTNQESGAIE